MEQVMASRPLLVTQSGGFEIQDSSKFPSVKIPRFISGGLAENTSRCQRRQKLLPVGDKVDVDLHEQQVTLLPTSTEGLSIPPSLLFTKDQTREIMIVVTANESKSR